MNSCAILLVLSDKTKLFNKVKREEPITRVDRCDVFRKRMGKDYFDCICIGVEMHTRNGDHIGISVT